MKRNLVAFVPAVLLLLTAASVFGQRTTMVSVNSAGTNGGNNNSGYYGPSMSADGRFVAFISKASDLTATNDTNGKFDVYVRDMQTGVTTLASINSAGTNSGSDDSYAATVSANGRVVAFWSKANDLVTDDPNFRQNVFVRDLTTGTTTRIVAGGNADQYEAPQVSSDGRYIFFTTEAGYLVPGDGNADRDIFMRDMQTGQTTLVTGNFLNTGSANLGTREFQTSSDGRFVSFTSSATNLVPNDTNATDDIFVRDITTGTTVRASVNSSGVAGDQQSLRPYISGNGRFVSFTTLSRLARNDTNDRVDVYVHDLHTHRTTVASLNYIGTLADGASGGQMSADGRYIYLTGNDGYLVPDDNNGKIDAFVRDMQTGVTTLASGGITRSEYQYAIATGGISPNGRFVTFGLDQNPPMHLYYDFYVRDMVKGTTSMVNGNLSGTGGGNGLSYYLVTGNSSLVYTSTSSDLVSNDNNGSGDVFAFKLSRPAGDYDGDGKTDAGAFADGLRVFSTSSDGALRIQAFDESGATPVTSADVVE
jgi:archaellum component FlaF (FlaF/FlaG flagellin family)